MQGSLIFFASVATGYCLSCTGWCCCLVPGYGEWSFCGLAVVSSIKKKKRQTKCVVFCWTKYTHSCPVVWWNYCGSRLLSLLVGYLECVVEGEQCLHVGHLHVHAQSDVPPCERNTTAQSYKTYLSLVSDQFQCHPCNLIEGIGTKSTE